MMPCVVRGDAGQSDSEGLLQNAAGHDVDTDS